MPMQPRTPQEPSASGNPEPTNPNSPQAYEPPRLIEYGPLAKITQTTQGSTGESSNFTMRKCL